MHIVDLDPTIEAMDSEFDDDAVALLVTNGIASAVGLRSGNDEPQEDEEKSLLEVCNDEWRDNVESYEIPAKPYAPADYVKSGDKLIELYLKDISNNALLTKEGVIFLAKLIHLAQGDEPTHEEREVANWAINKLYVSNLRLVVSIVKSYSQDNVPLLDLIQEGNLGLRKAVIKFDHKRGFEFSTFATGEIRSALQKAVADNAYPANLPKDVFAQIGPIARVRNEYLLKHKREMPNKELSAYINRPVDLIKALDQFHQRALSFDRKLGVDEGADFYEIMPASDAPDDEAIKNIRIADFRRELEVLNADAHYVVMSYHGIDRSKKQFAEIAEDLGIPIESAKTIYRRALAKLRTELDDWSADSFI